MNDNLKDVQLRWTSPSEDAIRWFACEDGFVVYHRPSGATHFLNASSKTLIEEILREAKDVEAVVAEFADIAGLVDPEALHLEVRDMLMRFDELGLIRQP